MRQKIVQRLGFRQEIRILLSRREAQDGAEVAAQHDGQFAVLGHQRHLIDQRPQDLRRLRAAVLMPQVLGKPCDALGIERRHVRVQQGRRLVGIGQLLRQLGLARFKALHVVDDGLDRTAGLQRGQQLRQFPVDTGKLVAHGNQIGAALHAEPVHLFGELGAELPEQARLHQVLSESVQDRGLQRVAADIDAIVAGALVARRRAAQKILRDHRVAAPAAAAFDQAGEEVLRAPPVVQRIAFRPGSGREGEFALPGLDRVPEALDDDAQIRHLLCHPFAFRVQPRHPAAGIGILDVAQPVPDEAADIKLVVEDAGAALAVAMNGGRTPFPAHGAGHALAVQRHGDGARREAGIVFGEDAADDSGLRFVDGAVAADRLAVGVEPLDHVVAVGIAAAGLAVLDPAAQAPAGLVGQVLDEQRVHRALQPDMQLADLPLRQGEHPHVGIAHALVDTGDVFLIPADAVQRLGQHQVEAAPRRIQDQCLEAGPLDHAGAGDGMVGIFLDHRPAFFLGPQPAHAELVGDRRFALQVGRITGIDRDLHLRASWSVGMLVTPLALLGLDEIPRRVPGQQADQFRKARVGGGQGSGSGRFCDHPEPFRNCLSPPCHCPVPLPARRDPRRHKRGAGLGGITGGFGRIASGLGAAQRKPALPRLLQRALRGGTFAEWRKNTKKSRDISSQVTRSAGFRSSEHKHREGGRTV